MLLRDLRAAPTGLSAREAKRRLVEFGPNELRRRGGAVGGTTLSGSSRTHSRSCCGSPRSRPRREAADPHRRDRRGDRAERPLRLRPGAAGRARRGALERYLPQRATVFRDGRRCEVEAASSSRATSSCWRPATRSRPTRGFWKGAGGRPLDPDGRVAHRLPVVQAERPSAAARGAGPRLQRHDGDRRRGAGRRLRHRHGDPAWPDRRALAAGRP